MFSDEENRPTVYNGEVQKLAPKYEKYEM